MPITIEQSDLQADPAAVIQQIAAGESFVITLDGRPIADLVPHRRDAARRRFLPVHEVARILAEYSNDDAREWVGELAGADDDLDDGHADPFDPQVR